MHHGARSSGSGTIPDMQAMFDDVRDGEYLKSDYKTNCIRLKLSMTLVSNIFGEIYKIVIFLGPCSMIPIVYTGCILLNLADTDTEADTRLAGGYHLAAKLLPTHTSTKHIIAADWRHGDCDSQ